MNNIDGFAKHLEAHICPLTGQTCKAGSHADCEHFWECVRQALELLHVEGAHNGLGAVPKPKPSPFDSASSHNSPQK